MIFRSSGNQTFTTQPHLQLVEVFTTDSLDNFSFSTPIQDARGNKFNIVSSEAMHSVQYPRLHRLVLLLAQPADPDSEELCHKCGHDLTATSSCTNQHCIMYDAQEMPYEY